MGRPIRWSNMPAVSADAESAVMWERVQGHEWRVELREHALPEVKKAQGAPTIVVVIRCDGKLLATVYPVQVGGIGVQIASTKLDFDEPWRIEPDDPDVSKLAPAVIFLRKDHQGQGGENGQENRDKG